MKKIITIATACACLSFAAPAQAQFFSPYTPANAGNLLGLQTGHISVLNGGILNGGILNGSPIGSGNVVGNGILNNVLNGALNGSGVGAFFNRGKSW